MMSDEMNKKETVVVAFKGLDLNLRCRDYQFEIGKSYTHEGDVKRCESGFHSCEYPLHIFDYYHPASTRFALVEASGKIDREEDGDTKLASAKLHIKAEIKIPDLVTAAIKWITDKCDLVKASSATGSRSASSATGSRRASSATGSQSASSATGDQSASSATGDQSAASAIGYRSASSATGSQSAASATGYQSAASATGYQSASSATGDQSAASATGYQSASSVTGKNSVAINIGIEGKAKADKNGAIILCNHDSDCNIRHIRASKVGENGIKPDVWYVLNDAGAFEEAAR